MEKEIDIKQGFQNSRKKWFIFGGIILVIIILVIIFFLMSSDDPIFWEPSDGYPMGPDADYATAPGGGGGMGGGTYLESVDGELEIYNASEFDSKTYCYPNIYENLENQCGFLPYHIRLGAIPSNICNVTLVESYQSEVVIDKYGFGSFIVYGSALIGDCDEYEDELQETIRTKINSQNIHLNSRSNIDGHMYISISSIEFIDSVGQLENILDYLAVRLVWHNKEIKKDYLEMRKKLDDYPDDLDPDYLYDSELN